MKDEPRYITLNETKIKLEPEPSGNTLITIPHKPFDIILHQYTVNGRMIISGHIDGEAEKKTILRVFPKAKLTPAMPNGDDDVPEGYTRYNVHMEEDH
jgi:hypothetical protein